MTRGAHVLEGDFDSFFETPFACYPRESHFVSLMRSDLARALSQDRNPLFASHGRHTYFTALRDGSPIGRVVAHIHDAANRLHGSRRGYFGFFDCVDDPGVARLLLGRAEAWLSERGCDEIAGNFNLTAMQQIGVVTDGFEHRPYTDMHYNPPHIPRLLEACGYEAFFPMRTWELRVPERVSERDLDPKLRAALAAPDIRWSRVRRRRLGRTLEQIRGLLNESFAQNPMFVPLTAEEFAFQAQEMMWIVDPRITHLAYDGDALVGAAVCIPDLNPFVRRTRSRLGPGTLWHYLRHRLRCRRAVTLFIGVTPSHQDRGLMGALLFRLVRDLGRAGYTHAGGTWISDENVPSLRQAERLGMRPLHRLHLFRKPLPAA